MNMRTSARIRRALGVGFGLAGAVFILLAAVVSARAAGPEVTTVGQIVAGGDAFDGKDVQVTGTVEASVPAGDESAYNLRDGTRKLTVVSRSAPPAAGTHVQVVGKVRVFSGAGEGPDDPGNDFPPALFETTRQVVP
jgi:hypothetical protein